MHKLDPQTLAWLTKIKKLDPITLAWLTKMEKLDPVTLAWLARLFQAEAYFHIRPIMQTSRKNTY